MGDSLFVEIARMLVLVRGIVDTLIVIVKG